MGWLTLALSGSCRHQLKGPLWYRGSSHRSISWVPLGGGGRLLSGSSSIAYSSPSAFWPTLPGEIGCGSSMPNWRSDPPPNPLSLSLQATKTGLSSSSSWSVPSHYRINSVACLNIWECDISACTFATCSPTQGVGTLLIAWTMDLFHFSIASAKAVCLGGWLASRAESWPKKDTLLALACLLVTTLTILLRGCLLHSFVFVLARLFVT